MTSDLPGLIFWGAFGARTTKICGRTFRPQKTGVFQKMPFLSETFILVAGHLEHSKIRPPNKLINTYQSISALTKPSPHGEFMCVPAFGWSGRGSMLDDLELNSLWWCQGQTNKHVNHTQTNRKHTYMQQMHIQVHTPTFTWQAKIRTKNSLISIDTPPTLP